MNTRAQKTTVGTINDDVLAFTAGRDVELDHALIEADCTGTAAHVQMLAGLPVTPPLITPQECEQVQTELAQIVADARAGRFTIELADQDVHLAVERRLTQQLGAVGKKVHTARSRNDQVAVDLRLYARGQLVGSQRELAELALALVRFAEAHATIPMVGRTHMQPAMPSSVGLWATAHAESLLEDSALLESAYERNDQCPLGAAASYGVPLNIDRVRVAEWLGFREPVHNVLYANNARGKLESIILSACSQVMLTLSRLAQDLMFFSMPEFGYFDLPAAYCTGSSIMPQKKNPDVLELIRAKASRVWAHTIAVYDIVKSAPSGYNRDLQEAKEPFMEGLQVMRASLRIMHLMVKGLNVNADRLRQAFTPDVFATDRALELVAEGMPFRDAYHQVKENLDELQSIDPDAAVAVKTHWGAPAGVDFARYRERIQQIDARAAAANEHHHAVMQKLFKNLPKTPQSR